MKVDFKKVIKMTLIVFGYTLVITAFYFGWRSGEIPKIIKEAGIIAPILYVIFASAKAIFPVIPGEVVVALGVFIFGPILGFCYALTGLTIGSSTAFFVSRRFGKPFVKWLMGEKRFAKIDKLTGKKTLFTFFLIYLAPGTPDDFVTYIAGLTNLGFLIFLPIIIIGRAPSLVIYAIAGSSLIDLDIKMMFFWWAVLFGVVALLYVTKNHFDKGVKHERNSTKKT